MPNFIKKLAAIFFFLLLTIQCFDAETVQADTVEGREGVIRVGCYDLKSFINKNATGNYFGHGVAYLDKLSEYTGWKFNIIVANNDELMRMLTTGEIDFLMPVGFNRDRITKYAFSSYPMGEQSIGVYVLKSKKNIFFNDFLALQGLRIGSVRNTYPALSMRKYAEDNHFTYLETLYPNLAELHRALESGEVDAVCRSGLSDIPSDYRQVGITELAPFYLVAPFEKYNGPFYRVDKAIRQVNAEQPDFNGILYKKYLSKKDTEEIDLTREEFDYMRRHANIVVSSFNNRYPLTYFDHDSGQMSGAFIDLMKLVSQKTGLQFQFQPAPENNDLAELLKKDQSVDLVIGLILNGDYDNNQFLRMSVGIMGNEIAIAGSKKHMFDPRHRYNVAIPESDKGIINLVRKNHPNYVIFTYPKISDCLRAISNGYVDAAMENLNILSTLLHHPEFEDLSVWYTYNAEGNNDYCIASRFSTDPRLISIINKGILSLKRDDMQSVIVKNNVANTEKLTMQDLLHKYKLILPVGLALITVSTAWAIAAFRIKQKHLNELQKANNDLTRANNTALAAIEESRRSNNAKGEFLSRMSHDIRTPLNGVIGMTALAAEQNKDPQVADYLDKIDVSGHFLLSLVNDILDISKIDAGKMDVHLEPYLCLEFIKYLESVVKPMCEAKELHFNYSFPEIKEAVLVDKLKFNRIFFNLLSNAVKFTPPGGHVSITMSNCRYIGTSMAYDISVKDDGIGISEQFQEKLFTPFEQEKPSGTDNNVGSGLGLAITVKFIHLMGGSIKLTSAPGKGSEFVVHLASRIVQVKPQQEKIYVGAASIAGKNFLIAEDNDINSEILVQMLEKQGANATLARNGAEAVRLFASSAVNTFDAILMDVRMPIMDGKEATRRIRQLPRAEARTIPIIAATANAYDEDVESCLLSGMNAHISKPINPSTLYETLQKLTIERKIHEESTQAPFSSSTSTQ